MAGNYRWETLVYDDGTISENGPVQGKKLLFWYTNASRDHAYDFSSWIEELHISSDASAEELRKVLKNPSIESGARKLVESKLEKKDFS